MRQGRNKQEKGNVSWNGLMPTMFVAYSVQECKSDFSTIWTHAVFVGAEGPPVRLICDLAKLQATSFFQGFLPLVLRAASVEVSPALYDDAESCVQRNIKSRGENEPDKPGCVRIRAERKAQNENQSRVYACSHQSPQGRTHLTARALPRGQHNADRSGYAAEQKHAPLRVKCPGSLHHIQPCPQDNK